MSPRNRPEENGWIEVITGCMFSGKTSELLERVKRAELSGHDVKLYKPAVDDRYGETEIGSHNGETRKAEVVEDVSEIRPEAYVIGIDEANFFDNELAGKAEELADEGHRVIISGLDSTFRAEPFEPVPELMSKAEFIDKLNAVCVKCGSTANRTQRIVDGKPAHVDDPTVVVGADEKYEARCRSCFEIRTD
ncbi:MAG: thymidine kinase [Candidatus Nanohaloarchaea archaeon]